MEGKDLEILLRECESWQSGIEVDGGLIDFYVDAEKIISTPEGRELLKREHKERLHKLKIEEGITEIVIPEDYLIRAPSIEGIMKEISEELNLPLTVFTMDLYITPELIKEFRNKLSHSDLEYINQNKFDKIRITIQPNQVIPSHKTNEFIQLIQVIGGRYRSNGRFYGFGHRFMINRGEEHSYDNIGFDRPLELFSLFTPHYNESSIEYLQKL